MPEWIAEAFTLRELLIHLVLLPIELAVCIPICLTVCRKYAHPKEGSHVRTI